jgi:hypothetical protein
MPPGVADSTSNAHALSANRAAHPPAATPKPISQPVLFAPGSTAAGLHETPLPGVHYGLREGDLIAFTAQHRPRGQPRVENGTRGQVTTIHAQGVTVTLDGSHRQIHLPHEDLDSLRLAYAQHVYRQQDATVERSIVLSP